MSQIDQLIYFPLLVWFIIFLFAFYILIFKTIVPFIYIIYTIRSNYFMNKIISNKNISNVIHILQVINKKNNK